MPPDVGHPAAADDERMDARIPRQSPQHLPGRGWKSNVLGVRAEWRERSIEIEKERDARGSAQAPLDGFPILK
jgi:hypothetical protein